MTVASRCRRHQSDPFNQGIPRDVVLRLLAGSWSSEDYEHYLRTEHWAGMRASAFTYHGPACVLCDATRGLQVHHRPGGYKRLFREQVERHLTVIFGKCHRRYH